MAIKLCKIAIGNVIAAVIIILDQVIKNIVVKNMTPGDSIPIIPDFLSITYRQNTGIAFSLFENAPTIIFVILSILIIIGLFLFLKPYLTYLPATVFFALITGGALGNMIDRVRRFDEYLEKNFVVDYINFHFFPTFNLADICICIGIFLLVIYILFIETKYSIKTTNKDTNPASLDADNSDFKG